MRRRGVYATHTLTATVNVNVTVIVIVIGSASLIKTLNLFLFASGVGFMCINQCTSLKGKTEYKTSTKPNDF